MSDYGFILASVARLKRGETLISKYATAGRDIRAVGDDGWAVYDDVLHDYIQAKGPVAAASNWHQINMREIRLRWGGRNHTN